MTRSTRMLNHGFFGNRKPDSVTEKLCFEGEEATEHSLTAWRLGTSGTSEKIPVSRQAEP